MAVIMSIVVFIISFILLLTTYILLVATNNMKKKKMDKILKLITAYSLAIALVYCYQYLYL